jgi:hypothetical protein
MQEAGASSGVLLGDQRDGFQPVSLVYAATDTAVGWMIPLALVGSALMAAAIFATRSSHPSVLVPDRFGVTSSDVINVSRIRVAGVGGVGLLFVAGLVAMQYQLITVALLAGLIGGAIGALAVIFYRRGHRLSAATR